MAVHENARPYCIEGTFRQVQDGGTARHVDERRPPDKLPNPSEELAKPCQLKIGIPLVGFIRGGKV